MKILIICSFFPPDTEIGAVKPYMIAKYLSQFGHKVTVIRMGYIKETADNSYGNYKKDLEVLTAQGNDSDVAKYERGEPIKKNRTSNALAVPKYVDLLARFFLQPLIVYRRKKIKDHFFTLQKRVIDDLKAQGRSFDVVYSTFFQFENIFSGEYAAKIFKAKWIMEFRDPIRDTKVVNYPGCEVIWKIYANKVQRHAVETCDLCTCVSEELANDFRKVNPNANIKVMYNGYDNSEIQENQEIMSEPEHLTLCYTGTLWRESARALEVLLVCLQSLITSSQINQNKLKFHYAGRQFEEAQNLFQKCGVSDILVNHKYVTRKDAEVIQFSSDIYVVLSWNTHRSRGVLTGKFYEGIRAKKPILSVVVGNEANSELYCLNEKYNYGFCYETSQENILMPKLKEFLLNMYKEKILKGKVTYDANENLCKDFHYKNISKKFENWCLELLGQ